MARNSLWCADALLKCSSLTPRVVSKNTYVFTFFSKCKKRDFYVFLLSHTFSRTLIIRHPSCQLSLLAPAGWEMSVGSGNVFAPRWITVIRRLLASSLLDRLWAYMTSSTKPEVHHCQRRTAPRPQWTCAEDLVKFEVWSLDVQFLRCASGEADWQIDTQTRLSQWKLFNKILPPPTAQNYSLRNRLHNRQLPDRISRITDCNFTVRMLYCNMYWLLYILDLRFVFTARCYASAVLAMALCLSVCLSVRLSVTSRSSTKTAKRRITQTTTRDSPRTLVFWSQISPRNSTGVTPTGAPNAGGVGQNRRLSTSNRLYIENGTRQTRGFY